MDVLAGRPACSRATRRNGRGMGALCRGHGAAHGRRVRRRRTLSGPGFPRRGREARLGAPPVQAQDTGTVRGTVTLVENDDPVDGAVVLVLGAGAFTFTDEGTFEITNVPVGSYVVTAQREHLTTDRQTVTVCTWTSAPALRWWPTSPTRIACRRSRSSTTSARTWGTSRSAACRHAFLADALLRQVVLRLPAYPERGVAPTDAFQRQCHRWRDAGPPVERDPRPG